MAEKLTFLQISDTHIEARAEVVGGVKPVSILSRAIADIKDNFSEASFVVHTGDVANSSTEDDYKLYESLVRDLNIPIYHIRGNHDKDARLFSDFFSDGEDEPLHWHFRLANWHFVGSDCAAKCGGSEQHVNAEELTWLNQVLLDNSDCPTVLFLHCHFYPIHSEFLDAFMMCDAGFFASQLAQHECVRYVVVGHLHHATLSISRHVVLSSPALSWQFVPMAPSPAHDDVAPGYRVFEMDGEESALTYVRRLGPVPKNEHPVELHRGRIAEES
jgi:Icc protein